ncbi:MAG TPA: CpXC domain-containing protein [Nitrospirota bacterium]|nr:CpXC domain-containing protein [Nitrospirota bacterium]
MSSFLIDDARSYRCETFCCSRCNRNFKAKVITWVDVARTTQARKAILQQEFNVVQCVYCGSTGFADVPFFYEDFEKRLLNAVFPLGAGKQNRC